MIVKTRKRFISDLAKIKSIELLEEAEYLIEQAEKCSKPDEIPGFKWMTGYANCARIKAGNYRMGVEITGNTIIFKCFLYRAYVYEQFP